MKKTGHEPLQYLTAKELLVRATGEGLLEKESAEARIQYLMRLKFLRPRKVGKGRGGGMKTLFPEGALDDLRALHEAMQRRPGVPLSQIVGEEKVWRQLEDRTAARKAARTPASTPATQLIEKIAAAVDQVVLASKQELPPLLSMHLDGVEFAALRRGLTTLMTAAFSRALVHQLGQVQTDVDAELRRQLDDAYAAVLQASGGGGAAPTSNAGR